MKKKTFLIVAVAVIAALVGGYLFWRYWHGGHPDLLAPTYESEKFGYSVEYPTHWQVGYLGESQEQGNPVWFVSSPEDIELAEGGLPHEVMVPIVVHDLGELAEIDPPMLEIESSWDWVNWKCSQGTGHQYESYQDDEIMVDGKPAVRTTYGASSDDGGPWIVVILYDSVSDLVYQIEYVGRQPYYDTNLHNFELILDNFRTNN